MDLQQPNQRQSGKIVNSFDRMMNKLTVTQGVVWSNIKQPKQPTWTTIPVNFCHLEDGYNTKSPTASTFVRIREELEHSSHLAMVPC
jgi:hypothetical protein